MLGRPEKSKAIRVVFEAHPRQPVRSALDKIGAPGSALAKHC